MKKNIFCLLKRIPLLFFSFSLLAHAHRPNKIEHMGGVWFETSASKPINKDSNIWYLAKFRTICKDSKKYFDQYIFRFGLGYLWKDTSLWLGYAITPSYEDKLEDFLYQNRFWQDFTYERSFFYYRSRLEQRWTESNKGIREKMDLNTCDVNIRWRHRFLFTPETEKRINPMIYNELFFNLKKTCWANKKGLSKNRLFLGFWIPLAKEWTLELGYINQYEPGSCCTKKPKSSMCHLFSVALRYW